MNGTAYQGLMAFSPVSTICNISGASTDKIESLKLVKLLRDANISVDFDFNAKKFTKQMEKASKVAKFAIILGEDEINSGMVSIKNLFTSEQTKIDRNDVVNYFN